MTVGGRATDLDTPALLVDLDILESNIARMIGIFREHGVGWRPHTKAIKIPAIAHKLIAAGAHGVTVAKLSEAEVMASAGIQDILITGPVVGAKKAALLANLSKQAKPIAVVDSVDHVDMLDAAGKEYGAKIRTVIEVDLGMHRCGVQPGDEAVAPTEEAIASGTYPLARPLFFYFNPGAPEPTRAFLSFVQSEEGRHVVRSNGGIPAAQ